ncbi:MAG TPA: hypothetical protein DCL08_07335 [Anaerolineaceae bacterium]|nr:hypothetical protein [Anaerolineaceae bacterium]
MNTKISHIKIIVIIIVVALSIAACNASGGASAEVEALQQQVDALATQNAILLEERQDSANGNVSGEVDAPAPPESDTAPQIAINTPTPESLPTEPVKAGTPITYEGWSMTVHPEIISCDPGGDFHSWGFKIFIRNLSETGRFFRYTMAGINIRDNIGNTYDYAKGNSIYEYLNDVKNLNVPGESSATISSGRDSTRYFSRNNNIQAYVGSIPLEASQMIISFDNFGPFTGVEVIIDL